MSERIEVGDVWPNGSKMEIIGPDIDDIVWQETRCTLICSTIDGVYPVVLFGDTDIKYFPNTSLRPLATPSVPPPARDWKPDAPCTALVEVFVKEIRGDKAVVFIDHYYPMEIPLSSIHPMTGRDGGKVCNSCNRNPCACNNADLSC